MRAKTVGVLLCFLLLSMVGGFTGEAKTAQEKKKTGTYGYKALTQPKKQAGEVLAAGDAFYWDNAVLEPGDTVNCNSSYENYWISLYEVSVNDTFLWRFYNPALDFDTGLPTGAYQNYSFSSWTYYGNRWEWRDLYGSYIYYYNSNAGPFAAGIYITGNDAIHYAGPWKVEIWRNHEGNMTLLTTGYFTLIDNLIPSAYFNAPLNGATVQGRVPVVVNAGDNIKIAKVEVYADNTTTGQSYLLKEFTSPVGDNLYNFTWATGQYPLGKYTLRARSTDAYNNTSEEAKIEVVTSAVVGVVKIEVLNSILPPGVQGPVTVWSGHFDTEGNIVPDNVQYPPIEEYLNDEFDLIIHLDAYPARPDWLPYAKYKWQLWGGPNSGSFTTDSAWAETIRISTAGRPTDRFLGPDELKLEFKFYAPLGAAAIAQSSLKGITPQASTGQVGDMVGDWGAVLSMFIKPKITIISPAMDADFDLDQNTYTSTAPINFQAAIDPPMKDQVINWEVKLNYRTSGSRCAACDDTRTFTTVMDGTNEVHQETFTSMGGSLEINACVTAFGRTTCTDPKEKATITGVAIPDDTITARLVSLYSGGATPRLMTGLAMQESTYKQFADNTLFNRLDKWPLESYDGGSHIGLMMPPTTMNHAWNWLDNTQFCVNLFLVDKMGISRTAVSRMRALYPGLRDLTGSEYENMALVLYGPYADAGDAVSGLVQRQYYVVNDTGIDWIINTGGNGPGVQYANGVRSKIR